MRLDAYYYSFEPTGVQEIDEILSCVACAGKAFHGTEDWNVKYYSFGEQTVGNTPVEWIQNAANRAATKIKEKGNE